MKEPGHCLRATLLILVALALAVPATAGAQPLPVGPPLVRQGDFAVVLLPELGLDATDDEVEAESRLADAGIFPRNGWIADYPVTPDILGELQRAVAASAGAGKIPLSADEALRRFQAAGDKSGLSVMPYAAGQGYAGPASGGTADPEGIIAHYADQGAPVYTFYTPPPDYYYLYAWVPYPVWCRGFWFPGFFILHDFHRQIVARNRVTFVSNHFTDARSNRVYRVDPLARFNGKTYTGIGMSRSKSSLSTGVPRSDRDVFNAPRTRMAPGMVNPPWGTPGSKTQPPWGAPGITTAPPWGSPEAVSPGPGGAGKDVRPPKPVAPPPRTEGPAGPHGSGGRAR